MKLLERILVKEEREPLSFAMADWFYKQGDGIVSQKAIADQINLERRAAGFTPIKVNYGNLNNMICQVRERLESRYRTTLVCFKKSGYKIATPQEQAEYTMGMVKRTIQYADRTTRLFPGINRQYIPAAMKKVFGESTKQISDLRNGAQNFILGFNQMRKEKEKQESKLKEIEAHGKINQVKGN